MNLESNGVPIGEEMTLTHGGRELDYKNSMNEPENEINFIQNQYIDDIDAHFGGEFDNEYDGDMVFQPKDPDYVSNLNQVLNNLIFFNSLRNPLTKACQKTSL